MKKMIYYSLLTWVHLTPCPAPVFSASFVLGQPGPPSHLKATSPLPIAAHASVPQLSRDIDLVFIFPFSPYHLVLFCFFFVSLSSFFFFSHKTKDRCFPSLSLSLTWPISCCPLFYSPLEQNSVKSYPYSLSPSLLPLALHHATQTSPRHPSEDYTCHS